MIEQGISFNCDLTQEWTNEYCYTHRNTLLGTVLKNVLEKLKLQTMSRVKNDMKLMLPVQNELCRQISNIEQPCRE